MKKFGFVLLVLVITACGGGDYDEADAQRKVQPPNCAASKVCK